MQNVNVGPGKPLSVRVLLNGKLAVGVKLIGDYRSALHEVSVETNAEGRAEVMVRNEGLNIIGAEVYVPVENGNNINELGLFTSLTFLGARTMSTQQIPGTLLALRAQSSVLCRR